MVRVVDMSGEYYDWTKTMQPETPWKHDYNRTLVIKIFLCSRDGQGNVGKVYLKFQKALEVIRKLDRITFGLPKIAYLVGWQYNGHDSKYPSWEEVNQHLMRKEDNTPLESLRWLTREAKAFNTTISLHINMIDAYMDSPLWKEYLENDIIAKDEDGIPIKGELHSGMQSYQISYTQEWKLGYAQRRIDGLLEMIPELEDAGTIHIDAFHSMRPCGPDAPISPYLGYTIDQEISTQRKIFRYWQSKGMDVTSEGAKYWLRNDPFIGLQAMTWHFSEANFFKEDWLNKPPDFTALPAQLSCYTPMQAEIEIMRDPENLSGLKEQFCLKVVPWYYRRNADFSKESNAIITENTVICPILWKDKAVVAYSKNKNLENMEYGLPSTWIDVQQVQLFDLNLDGLISLSVIKVRDSSVKLNIDKDRPVILMPATV